MHWKRPDDFYSAPSPEVRCLGSGESDSENNSKALNIFPPTGRNESFDLLVPFLAILTFSLNLS